METYIVMRVTFINVYHVENDNKDDVDVNAVVNLFCAEPPTV